MRGDETIVIVPTRRAASGRSVLALPKGIADASWSMLALQAGYQGVVAMIVAMMLYVYAVSTLGPGRVGTLMALVPPLAGLAAAPVLGEPLTGWLAAGLTLVGVGAYLGNRVESIAISVEKPKTLPALQCFRSD